MPLVGAGVGAEGQTPPIIVSEYVMVCSDVPKSGISPHRPGLLWMRIRVISGILPSLEGSEPDKEFSNNSRMWRRLKSPNSHGIVPVRRFLEA